MITLTLLFISKIFLLFSIIHRRTMFTVIIFTSCLFYTLTLGQTNTTVVSPSLGNIYSIPYNNSYLYLNYTFLYPANYKFDNLYVNFTLYDFNTDSAENFAAYVFGYGNFTNSNISLPWVQPNITLGVGDYIFGCFNWVQTNFLNITLATYSVCNLTRTTTNSTVIPVVYITLDPPVVTLTGASIKAYVPAGLPYNVFDVSATLNDTIASKLVNSSSNNTYSSINVYSFTNLTSNTIYNLCVKTDYSNANISGTEITNNQCQVIQTLSGGGGGGGGGSSNGVKINLSFITLLIIFILM